jgi:hypothetical protein
VFRVVVEADVEPVPPVLETTADDIRRDVCGGDDVVDADIVVILPTEPIPVLVDGCDEDMEANVDPTSLVNVVMGVVAKVENTLEDEDGGDEVEPNDVVVNPLASVDFVEKLVVKVVVDPIPCVLVSKIFVVVGTVVVAFCGTPVVCSFGNLTDTSTTMP